MRKYYQANYHGYEIFCFVGKHSHFLGIYLDKKFIAGGRTISPDPDFYGKITMSRYFIDRFELTGGVK